MTKCFKNRNLDTFCFHIPSQLLREFRFFCHLNGDIQRQMVMNMIKDYIKKTKFRLNIEDMEYSGKSIEKVLAEGRYQNYHFIVMNLGTHPTAYVEIPRTHKYFGKHYDDIDIYVHGGLTFARSQFRKKKNSWFIGWDYAHCGDYYGFDEEFQRQFPELINSNDKKWTTVEILKDVINVINQLEEANYENIK